MIKTKFQEKEEKSLKRKQELHRFKLIEHQENIDRNHRKLVKSHTSFCYVIVL